MEPLPSLLAGRYSPLKVVGVSPVYFWVCYYYFFNQQYLAMVERKPFPMARSWEGVKDPSLQHLPHMVLAHSWVWGLQCLHKGEAEVWELWPSGVRGMLTELPCSTTSQVSPGFPSWHSPCRQPLPSAQCQHLQRGPESLKGPPSSGMSFSPLTSPAWSPGAGGQHRLS